MNEKKRFRHLTHDSYYYVDLHKFSRFCLILRNTIITVQLNKDVGKYLQIMMSRDDGEKAYYLSVVNVHAYDNL